MGKSSSIQSYVCVHDHDHYYVLHQVYFDALLPSSSRVVKVSIFQSRHSPFFTRFVLRFASFS